MRKNTKNMLFTKKNFRSSKVNTGKLAPSALIYTWRL